MPSITGKVPSSVPEEPRRERKPTRIKFIIEDGDVPCAMCCGCISKGMTAYFMERTDSYLRSVDARPMIEGYHFHELCYRIKDIRKDYQIISDTDVVKSI